MNPKLWSLFHDGTITSILGAVPGDVTVTIELEYIRQQFPESGSAFCVRLFDCTDITLSSFTDGASILHFVDLQLCDLEVLSAELDDAGLCVITTNGLLRLRYGREQVSLDAGRLLDYDELAAAATRAMHKGG